MADAKDQDQSMEEILQSIKRIIAEEGDPVPAPPPSEVLELTEMLGDDGSITSAAVASPVSTMSIDEIMAAPLSSLPEVAPAPVAVSEPLSTVSVPVDMDALISEGTREASSAALNALKQAPAPSVPAPAPTASMAFRSGATVEDLVLEALRPMLKEWLDANLTSIVERLVEREVRRLSNR